MKPKEEATKVKESIFKDLRDYMTSSKILFPVDLQTSISQRINLIYSLGGRK